MSRTVKGSPSPGTDWWGRRPLSSWARPGRNTKWLKRLVAKKERAQGRKEATSE